MKTLINLLPPKKKRDLQTGMIMAYAQTMVTILFIISIIVSGTLISFRVVLNGEHKYLQKQTEETSSSESTDIMTTIRQTNSYLVSFDSLQESLVPWTDILKDIALLVPDQAQLYRFRTDQTNRIFLDGMASTRDDALNLLKLLKEQPYLYDIKSPLSNILQKTDVQFSFEMKYGLKDDD